MRTNHCRRLFIVDLRGRIVQAQRGSPLEDRVFGIDSRAAHLPDEIERHIRGVIADRRVSSFAEPQTLTCGRYRVRIFTLAGRRTRRIGVMVELDADRRS